MGAPGRVPPGRGGANHQLVIAPEPDLRNIAVTCTCLRNAGRDPLGVQLRWAGGEAWAAWLDHLAAEAEPEAAI